VNAFPPNAGHHSGSKSKGAKTTTHQTLVYNEPDPDADGHGEAVHLSDGSCEEYHVSLPDSQTEPDTEIDEEDFDCYDESEVRCPVQPWSHSSGNNRAKTVRILTCSGSLNVAIPPWTTGSGMIITPGIPVQC